MLPAFVHLTDEVLSDGMRTVGCHPGLKLVVVTTVLTMQKPKAAAANSRRLFDI